MDDKNRIAYLEAKIRFAIELAKKETTSLEHILLVLKLDDDDSDKR